MIKCQHLNECLEKHILSTSKAAHGSPFPQISRLEPTEVCLSSIPSMRVGRHCQVQSTMRDLSLPPHLVLGNYRPRQDTHQQLSTSQTALLPLDVNTCFTVKSVLTHTLSDPHCVWKSGGVTQSMQSDKAQKHKM